MNIEPVLTVEIEGKTFNLELVDGKPDWVEKDKDFLMNYIPTERLS